MTQKATLEVGAILGPQTKAAFKAISNGFRAVAAGMKITATALAEIGKTKAAEGINKAATAVEKHTKSLDSQITSLSKVKKSTDEYAESTKKVTSANQAVSTTLAGLRIIITSTGTNVRKASKEFQELGGNSKNVGEDLKIVKEAFTKLSAGTKGSATEFLYAANTSKKLGQEVVALSQAITLAGASGKTWAKNLSYETIERAKASGALDIQARGLGKLTVEGLKALGLSNRQVNAMRKVMEAQTLYNTALKKAESISDPAKRKEQIALIERLGTSYGKTNAAFSAFTTPLKNVDSALIRLNQVIKASGDNALYAATKGIDKFKLSVAAMQGDIKVSSDKITVFNRSGLKALGDLSVESASKLGMMSKGFKDLIAAEEKAAQISGKNITSIRQHSDALLKQGSSVREITTALNKSTKEYQTHQNNITKTVEKYGTLSQLQSQIGKDAQVEITALKNKTKSYQEVQTALGNLAKLQKAQQSNDEANAKLISKNITALNGLKIEFKNLIKHGDEYGAKAERMIRNYSVQGTQVGLLRKEIVNLNKEWQATERGTKQAEAAFGRLQRAYDPLISSNDRFGASAKQLMAELAKSPSKYEATISALHRLKKEQREAAASTNIFKQALDRLSKSFKTYLSYQVVSNVIMSMRSAFTSGLAAMVDYDQALHDLRAITQATADETEQMGEVVKKVAASTKFSAGEVAVGMRTLGQAGFSAQESIESIDSVANLATGTLSDMASVVDLVTSSVRVFQVDTSKTSHIADVFANAVNGSKLTIDKLKTSFNYIGPVAKLAGASLEDVASTMMMLANQGIRASTIGTGLRQVFQKILEPTDEFKTAVKAAGLVMEDLSPKTNSMRTVIDNLSKVVIDADDAFRLFGMRGAAAVAALTNAGAAGFDEMRDKVDRSGTAAMMAEEQMKGLGVAIKNLKDTAGVLSVEIGEAGLTGIMYALTKSAKWLLDGMIKLVKSGFGELIITVSLATAAIVSLNLAFATLKSQAVVHAVMGITTALGGLTITTSGAAGAAIGLGAALKSLSATMFASPIGWFVGILTVAAGAIVYLTNKHDNYIKKIKEERAEYEQELTSINSYIERLESLKEQKNANAEGSVKYNELEKEHRELLKEIIDRYPHLSSELLSNIADVNSQTEALKSRNVELNRGIKSNALIEFKDDVKEVKKLVNSLATQGMDDDIVVPMSDETILKTKDKIADLSASIARSAIELGINIDEHKVSAEIKEAYDIIIKQQDESNRRKILGPWTVMEDGTGILSKSVDEQLAKLEEYKVGVSENFNKKDVEDYVNAMQIGYANIQAVMSKSYDDPNERVLALAEAYNVLNHIQKQFGRSESVVVTNKQLEAIKQYETKIKGLGEELKAIQEDPQKGGIGSKAETIKLQEILKAEEVFLAKINKITTGEYDVADMFENMSKDIDVAASDLSISISKLYLKASQAIESGATGKTPVQLMVQADLDALDLEKKHLQANVALIEATMKKARGDVELPDPAVASSEAYKKLGDELVEATKKLNEFKTSQAKKTFAAESKLVAERMKVTKANLKELETETSNSNARINLEVSNRTKTQIQADKEIRDNNKLFLDEKLKAHEKEYKELEDINASSVVLDKVNTEILKTKTAISEISAATAISERAIVEANRELLMSQKELATTVAMNAAESIHDPLVKLEAQIAATNSLNAAKKASLELTVLEETAKGAGNEIAVGEAELALDMFDQQTTAQKIANDRAVAQAKINSLDDYVARSQMSADQEVTIWKEAYENQIINAHERDLQIAYANENVMEVIRLKSQEFSVKNKNISETVGEQWESLPDKISDGFMSAFDSMADGTKSFKEAFGDMATSILKDIAKVIMRALIMNAILGIVNKFTGSNTQQLPSVPSGFGTTPTPTYKVFDTGAPLTMAAADGGLVPELADGGMVEGYSPTPVADNIDAKLTAGEYVQPVRSVKHYGTKFMEAVRTMKLPKIDMSTMAFSRGGAVPSISKSQTQFFADGGPVKQFESSAVNTSDDKNGDRDVIININNNAGAEVSTTQTKTANGGMQLDVMIDQAAANGVNNFGATFKAIQSTFGLRPALSRR